MKAQADATWERTYKLFKDDPSQRDYLLYAMDLSNNVDDAIFQHETNQRMQNIMDLRGNK